MLPSPDDGVGVQRSDSDVKVCACLTGGYVVEIEREERWVIPYHLYHLKVFKHSLRSKERGSSVNS